MEAGTTSPPVSAPASPPASAPRARTVLIRPTKGWGFDRLREVWAYRELLFFLAWRDVKIRYKQTAFGAAWALIQPLALMLVFWLFAAKFLHTPSQGFPYPVFVFSALLPWSLFSQAMAAAANSMIQNAQLVSKVYFPRLILPVAAVGPFLLDFMIGSVVLLGLIFLSDVSPGPQIALAPAFGLLALVAAMSVGTLLSAINARYRDVQAALPLLVQMWLFASPIAYPSTLVPNDWRAVYALNPMVGVIDGFRWAVLDAHAPQLKVIGASVLATLVLLIAGVIYFQRTERTFADVI